MKRSVILFYLSIFALFILLIIALCDYRYHCPEIAVSPVYSTHEESVLAALRTSSQYSASEAGSLKGSKSSVDKTIKPKLILILSSLGRSGSTMLSELMATKDNSVLFFEPDHLSENSACARVSECMVEYLRNILLCEYDNNFEQWLKNKSFIRYFHPVVRQCKQVRRCESKVQLRPLCQKAEVRLIKTIRVRLGFLESLLKDQMLDLKIVYLVRDLRASANSIKRMKWEDSPKVICPKVYDDLLAFEHLKSKYPNQLFKIQYEHFSIEPFNQSAELFEFAFGDEVLPEETMEYLRVHTTTDGQGAMNTMRNSKDHYQKWRWEIKEITLNNIEKVDVCVKAIEKLQYKLFKNLATARDQNVSLFIT